VIAPDTTLARRIRHLEPMRSLARLKPKVENTTDSLSIMTFHANAAPLRTLRLRSGLSQREVAELVGFRSDAAAYRHECSKSIPDLRTAMAYEIIFGVPISSMFSGLYRSIEPIIEEQISQLRKQLEDQPGTGPNAERDALKLVFLCERENLGSDLLPE
jgi:transcriptional regulator with XRE-family HTH domain